MKKYLLEMIVFITGMGIMIFELIASRVMAPYVGTTIIVWSCLIGVILAALSAGYWYGGRLADRKTEYYHLSLLIFFAAVFVALTGFFKIPFTNWVDKHVHEFKIESVIMSLALFAPGSFFMATVSPYAVRLRISDVKRSGTAVGNLYAVSTIGSIFGAFLTGLVLVTYLGNTKIIYLLATILFITALLAFRQRSLKAKLGAVVISIIVLVSGNNLDRIFLQKGVTFIRSQYLDIMITKGVDNYSGVNVGGGTGRPILQLQTGPATIQSAMFADDDNALVLPYTIFYKHLSKYFNPQINKILVVGGAGYSYPKDFLKSNPEGSVDVVEIDPAMTEAAKQYFNLPDDPRLHNYTEDGRVFLNRNQTKYDAIYMDSFRAYSVPFQLTTLETAEHIYNSLSDNGVVFINMISSIEGDAGKFFRAEYLTYKQVFPQLYIIRVEYPYTDVPQNLLLIASKSDVKLPISSTDPELNSYLQHAWDGQVANDVSILTDDYAPAADYSMETTRILGE